MIILIIGGSVEKIQQNDSAMSPEQNFLDVGKMKHKANDKIANVEFLFNIHQMLK